MNNSPYIQTVPVDAVYTHSITSDGNYRFFEINNRINAKRNDGPWNIRTGGTEEYKFSFSENRSSESNIIIYPDGTIVILSKPQFDCYGNSNRSWMDIEEYFRQEDYKYIC